MPNSNFSIGHDVSVDIFDVKTQAIVSFPAITGFTSVANTKQITSEPLNGPPQYAENPNGWHGTIDFDRTDPRVDLYFLDREARYFAGESQFGVTITETIRESDGSVTQMRYENAVLKFSQVGNWKAADKVSQRVDWVAGTRKRIV